MSGEPLENPDVVVRGLPAEPRSNRALERTGPVRVVGPITLAGETWGLANLSEYPRLAQSWVVPAAQVEVIVEAARRAGLVAREINQ